MGKINWMLIIVFFLGFVLRLYVSLLAHHGDLNNNISWATIAYENGFDGFYEGKNLPHNKTGDVIWPYSAPNQPPLTILVLTATRVVWQEARNFIWYMNWELLIFPSRLVWFWDDKGMDLMIKFPSILADLAIAFFIYKFVKSELSGKTGGSRKALIIATIWLFNPVLWYNSSLWGQTDPVVNLLGLLGIWALIRKKLPLFTVFYTLSVLFKGSLSIFAPILIVYALTQKYDIRIWLKSFVSGCLTIFVVSYWFHKGIDMPVWLFDLYKVRFIPGEIGFLTANAFNFWWLVNPGRVYDSVLFMGVAARVWGFILTSFFIIISGYLIFKNNSKERLIVSLMIVSMAAFLFMTRIHERYLYPFFPAATLFLAISPSYWPIYVAFSLIHLINLYNLFWVPGIEPLRNLLSTSLFPNILSTLQIMLLILSFRHFRRTKI
jgi:hypothetical protein